MRWDLKGRRAVVVGLGRSGSAAARLLLREGARVSVTDIRSAKNLGRPLDVLIEQGVQWRPGGQNAADFLQEDLVVLSPGVPPRLEEIERARRKGIPVIGELELGCAFLTAPVHAVTGTNGKSTTVSLLGEMYRRQGRQVFVGGNLGEPVCEAVLAGTDWEMILVEVSSFQLETILHFSPRMAALLNLSPDHLDRHGNLDSYQACKLRIFENQAPGDEAILNADDPLTRPLLASDRFRARVRTFSRTHLLSEGMRVRKGVLQYLEGGQCTDLCGQDDLAIQGIHNLENALAASLMALTGGCPAEGVARTLRCFKGLEHRLEFVREAEGVRYFNDSKGTNVAATLMSILSFDCPVILIAGGQDKGGDFTPLRDLLEHRVKQVILFGEARDRIRKSMGRRAAVDVVQTLQEAMKRASRTASKGDVVLFSPACASFDQFQNFQHRGQVFKEIVGCLQPSVQKTASCGS